MLTKPASDNPSASSPYPAGDSVFVNIFIPAKPPTKASACPLATQTNSLPAREKRLRKYEMLM
jgi:hypothetical protein